MASSDTGGGESRLIVWGTIVGGLLATAVGGTYFLEDRYLTDKTGVTEVEKEELATKEELQIVMQQTQGYLLELRIEQARKHQQYLLRTKNQRPLSSTEEQDLRDINQELERLLDLKERQR